MAAHETTSTQDDRPVGLSGRGWWLGCALVLLGSLLATVPTTGDIGLTWDEPSYRTSQVISGQWWEAMGKVRSRAEFDVLTSSDALLYYWPYARYGYNFHPPLAGQLNLLTYEIFGGWMKDIPSRRLASVFEYVATITLAFGFLSRRYGAWIGAIAAGALLVMPRVYGDGHIAGTDTPGLLLWVVTALAFWKGLRDPNARKWRVIVGVAVGLGFVEKMAAVAVLGPILGWMIISRLPATFRKGGRGDWIDAIVTSTAMLVPIGVAFREVLRLAKVFPPPGNSMILFQMHPATSIPGVILVAPMVVWFVRRLMGRILRRSPLWGVERPALEVWTAILAFAPAVGWLGNPSWWRETMPRMAHYYQLSADRRGALPDIRIMYWGQIYNYSLPWHNAWVLIAITVPVGILLAAVVGMLAKLRMKDALPWYFLVHLAFLPILRMLPTPGHDGIRLFLPTFFFLAAFAGWGSVAIGDGLARLVKRRALGRGIVAALVLGSAGWQLIRIHPFELSYYNELIGGPRGAWKSGFELSYWYDAFNDETLEALNREIPDGSGVDFFNELINTPTFACLQELGHLKGSIVLGNLDRDKFPHVWMLTHDSKATPFTRLAFAMGPKYPRTPRQLDGLRVVTLDSPETASRAMALDVLTRVATESEVAKGPTWVRQSPVLSPFGRFWGDGLTMGPPLAVDESILDWARRDPEGLRAEARAIASRKPGGERLLAHLNRPMSYRDKQERNLFHGWVEAILRVRPEALVEAVDILIARPDAVRAVLLKPGYTDPETVGGYLDKGVVR